MVRKPAKIQAPRWQYAGEGQAAREALAWWGTHLPARLAAAATLGLLLLLGASARGQTDLGGQRVGTSSGVFLKIPLDARSASMASAVSSCAEGPASIFTNPAGLGTVEGFSWCFCAVDYTAGIPVGAASAALPLPSAGITVGAALAGLSTSMEETDEFHPLGTGREFSYGAWALSLSAAKAMTDKLTFGLTVRGYYEALAREIGGPQLWGFMVDTGALYEIGYRHARIGLAVNNFGPDIRPSGEYTSRRNGSRVEYSSFSPPAFFRFGVSMDPYSSENLETLVSVEMGHPADHREVLRVGAEARFSGRIHLRAGYDFSADELKLHAGAGISLRLGDKEARIDYAFSEGGYFGDIHRWSVAVGP